MSGAFDPSNPPTQRGFYSRVIAAANAAVSGGTLGVAAIPIVADWGPEDSVVEIASSREYDDSFGTDSTDDRFAVVGALTGTGASGSGVTKVLAYRMPLSGNVAAGLTLNNTTPATALTLTAKYTGSKGNDIKVTTQDHPTDGSKDQLLVYDGSTLKETWSFVETNVSNLATQLNDSVSGSKYVTAVANITGVHLAHVTSSSLTLGADGTPVGSDYTDAMSKFETQLFNIFTVPNLTDDTIRASFQSWVETLNDTKRRVLFVEGGDADEVLSDAIARSAETSDNENFVNLGVNMFTELATGDSKSSAQMTGYLAGIIAGVGIKGSITFARLAGFDIVDSPDIDDIDSAIDGGVAIFSKDAHGIRIEAEVTTFTDDSDDDKPLETFSSLKEVRTLHQIDNDLTDLIEGSWIGQVANTSQTRDNLIGVLLQYFRTLEGETALQSGLSQVGLDPDQDNTGKNLYPLYSVTMTKSIERVLSTGIVS